MYNKYLNLVFLAVFCSGTLSAQEITFNKKTDRFESGGQTIATLTSEKVKSIGKSYFVKDPTGSKTLLAYELHQFIDTIGSPSVYYYSIEAPEQGYKTYHTPFYRAKEVGAHIVDAGILQADGSLNTDKLKTYFETTSAENIDYPSRHAFINDSLMQLINIPADPVVRDRKQAITANEYGKIGQGNVVIGSWELIEALNNDFNGSKNYKFLIRNSQGGIICVSWIALSGAHTYIFDKGIRSKESWQGLDLIKNNPLSSPVARQNYAAYLAQNLVRMGLL